MSRATMITGRLQHAINGLDTSRYPAADYDNSKTPFWPANFRTKGYQTACIGKWHLGEDVGHGREWDYSVIWDREGPKSNYNAYYEKTLVRYNGGERVPLGGYSTDRYFLYFNPRKRFGIDFSQIDMKLYAVSQVTCNLPFSKR